MTWTSVFLKLSADSAVHPGLRVTSFRRRWVAKQGLPLVTHSNLKMHFSLNKHLFTCTNSSNWTEPAEWWTLGCCHLWYRHCHFISVYPKWVHVECIDLYILNQDTWKKGNATNVTGGERLKEKGSLYYQYSKTFLDTRDQEQSQLGPSAILTQY